MDKKRKQILRIFEDESETYIETLFMGIELLIDDPENESAINEMFRAAHTLKGNSGAVGFKKLQDLTHLLENTLELIRDKKIVFDENNESIITDTVEYLSDIIPAAIKKNSDDTIEIDDIKNKLLVIKEKTTDDDISDSKNKVTINFTDREISDIINNETECYIITIKISEECMIKGARGLLTINDIKDFSTVWKTIPTISKIENEEFDDEFYIVIYSSKDIKDIEKTLFGLSEIGSTKIELLPKDSNILKAKYGIKSNQKSVSIQPKIKTDNTVKVRIELLDKLINIFGDMSVVLKILNKEIEYISSNKDFNKEILLSSSLKSNRLLRQLQQLILSIRLVPIASIFNKFPRLIRKISKQLDKKVELKIFGEDVELDKSIIDMLGDPLIHIIRNSLDHGIETPDKRAELNKTASGTILISAQHIGNNIVIVISDDGAGIDEKKVKEKALKQGLTTEKELAGLSRNDIFQFIFHPGFSTNEDITELSGRGVGMDVVLTAINRMRGNVFVESQKNEGTTITIKLPLTTAIIPALIFQHNFSTYTIPMDNIESTFDISEAEFKQAESGNLFKINDDRINLYNFSKFYNTTINGNNTDRPVYPKKVLLFKSDGNKYGVVVDKLVEQQEIMVYPIPNQLGNIPGVAGFSILGTGNPAVIIDLLPLLQKDSLENV